MIDDAVAKAASNSAAIPGLTLRIATSRIMFWFAVFHFFIPYLTTCIELEEMSEVLFCGTT